MENARLSEMIHLSLAETMREIARRSHGEVLERQGVLLYAAGPTDPALWNGVVRTEPLQGADALLAMADEFFGRLGRGYTLHTSSDLDRDLDEALQAYGRNPNTDAPQMILETPVPAPPLPPGVSIREVTNEQGWEDFLVTAGAAFKTLGVAPEVWRAAYPDVRSVAAPHIATFIAYADGSPAAMGMAYINYSVAEVIHIGTRPEYRRQGLGELVTRAVTNEGFNRGARLASLQSTPMGKSMYRRIGYREVGRYRWYISPARS
jgi:ribosomal protein S18 acetylase RimI-like enzyme